VWLLWSERRPTDRAVTGPMPHRAGPRLRQAGPAPGTRAAGDARGPRCHPGMLTPEEPRAQARPRRRSDGRGGKFRASAGDLPGMRNTHARSVRGGWPTRLAGPRPIGGPVAGPRQVVVEVAAADVLFLDCQIRGGWGEMFGVVPPYVPGNGVAGVVVSLGDGGPGAPQHRVPRHAGKDAAPAVMRVHDGHRPEASWRWLRGGARWPGRSARRACRRPGRRARR